MAATPKIVRRYVVHGTMPQKRTPSSGFFKVGLKEDGYFLDFNERALVFREGARNLNSLELPLYFIDKSYYQNKRMIESIGLSDDAGKVEIFVQYARLPVIDPKMLEDYRQEIMHRAEVSREELVNNHQPQAMFDLFRLEFCDQPITFLNYDPTEGIFRLKARAPFPPPIPTATTGKKERQNIFNDYLDTLCSQAAQYLIAASDTLPGLKTMELTLARMEPEPVNGLKLQAQQIKLSGFRKFGQRDLSVPLETEQERKKREKAELRAIKSQRKGKNKDGSQYAMSRREPSDELFDGTLAHESVLLSVRVPFREFHDLNRSKSSYTARKALELFDLRMDYDEDETALGQVESFFDAPREQLKAPVANDQVKQH